MASVVLLLLHTPPAVLSLKLTVEPAHTVAVAGVMAFGDCTTVTATVAVGQAGEVE